MLVLYQVLYVNGVVFLERGEKKVIFKNLYIVIIFFVERRKKDIFRYRGLENVLIFF